MTKHKCYIVENAKTGALYGVYTQLKRIFIEFEQEGKSIKPQYYQATKRFTKDMPLVLNVDGTFYIVRESLLKKGKALHKA